MLVAESMAWMYKTCREYAEPKCVFSKFCAYDFESHSNSATFHLSFPEHRKEMRTRWKMSRHTGLCICAHCGDEEGFYPISIFLCWHYVLYIYAGGERSSICFIKVLIISLAVRQFEIMLLQTGSVMCMCSMALLLPKCVLSTLFCVIIKVCTIITGPIKSKITWWNNCCLKAFLYVITGQLCNSKNGIWDGLYWTRHLGTADCTCT